jgi:hypothetical protein
MSLRDKTKKELTEDARKIAKRTGVGGYSTLNKDELIAWISKHGKHKKDKDKNSKKKVSASPSSLRMQGLAKAKGKVGAKIPSTKKKVGAKKKTSTLEEEKWKHWFEFGIRNNLFVRPENLQEEKCYKLYMDLEQGQSLKKKSLCVKKKNLLTDTITVILYENGNPYEVDAYLDADGFVVLGSGAEHMISADNLEKMPSTKGIFPDEYTRSYSGYDSGYETYYDSYPEKPSSLPKVQPKKQSSQVQTYETHCNGGRPFSVTIDKSKGVSIHVGESTKKKLFRTISKSEISKIFVGVDQNLQKSMETRGNSILIEMKTGEYLFIGCEIFTFETKNPIVSYHSPIGNNDIPYPYAVDSKKNSYLLLENVIVPPSTLLDEYLENGVEDIYNFYEDERKHRAFNKLKNKKMLVSRQ